MLELATSYRRGKREGRLIGIELLAPELVTLEAVNGILEEYGLDHLKETDLAPILAA